MVKAADRLLLGTRKGLMIFARTGKGWEPQGHHFTGVAIAYAFHDARTGLLWACQDHGHWGQKLSCSPDWGATWQDTAVPAYPEGAEISPGKPATLRYLWVLAPGHEDEPDTLWAGTEPGGLFVSRDRGTSWAIVEALWNHPSRDKGWFGGGRDNAGIHSIVIDPRNADHMFIAVSCAGVFETRDGGASWAPRNTGLNADFLPDPAAEVGQDPHFMVAAPTDPDTLWQQNHCGIYISRNGAETWQFVSQPGGPAHFGFAVAVDPHCPERAFVVPALSDENRIAIDGALCVCRTDDGGATWRDQRNGLPQEGCYDISYRHALDIADTALAFGSTTGNAFFSADLGESWTRLGNALPPIYSVRFAHS